MSKARISKVRVPAQAPASPAPAEAPAAPAPAANLAPITQEQALQVATAFALLATDDASRSATFGAKAALLASTLGTGLQLTYPLWDKQMAPFVKDAFNGSGLSETRIGAYASKFKVTALAWLTGDDALRQTAGEPWEDFLTRVRPLLEAFVFADGTRMVPINPKTGKVSKRGKKAGSKAANKKAAPAADAPSSASQADDAGHDVSRRHAQFVAAMGNEADGQLMLAIASDAAHLEAWRMWAKDRIAKAVDTSKPAKAPKAPAVEPDAKAKALNKELLEMANKTAPKAKANGAAA
jgi:hypothetical protein